MKYILAGVAALTAVAAGAYFYTRNNDEATEAPKAEEATPESDPTPETNI